MKELLLKALVRMDKARNIGYNGGITTKIADILDTSDLRKELEQLEAPTKNEYYGCVDTLSDTLSNSQITAECIKAGITDPEDIGIIKNNTREIRTVENVGNDIQWILAQRE